MTELERSFSDVYEVFKTEQNRCTYGRIRFGGKRIGVKIVEELQVVYKGDRLKRNYNISQKVKDAAIARTKPKVKCKTPTCIRLSHSKRYCSSCRRRELYRLQAKSYNTRNI